MHAPLQLGPFGPELVVVVLLAVLLVSLVWGVVALVRRYGRVADQRRVEELERRVEELERRVEEPVRRVDGQDDDPEASAE